MAAEHDPEALLTSLGIDMDDIRGKALDTTMAKLRDKALYGFTAVDIDGKRIDPRRLLPPEQQQTAAHYEQWAGTSFLPQPLAHPARGRRATTQSSLHD